MLQPCLFNAFVDRMTDAGWSPHALTTVKLKAELSGLANQARNKRALAETLNVLQARYQEVEKVYGELYNILKV